MDEKLSQQGTFKKRKHIIDISPHSVLMNGLTNKCE